MDTLHLTPLNMRIQEVKDVPVLSAFLQDAIIPPHSFHYSATDKTLSLMCQRFCWEEIMNPTLPHDDHAPYHRVNTALCFHNIESLHHRGLNTRTTPHLDTDHPFNILALHSEFFEHAQGDLLREQLMTRHDHPDIIHIICSGQAEIIMAISSLDISLKDMDHPWPTMHKPDHYDDEAYAESR